MSQTVAIVAAPAAPRILSLRDTPVMLDADLARLYGVPTGVLNQALKRNRRRFPRDFAFQMTLAECRILKSQSVISSGAHGGRRSRPWVFTEHGAIMAASVVNTRKAIDMSVFVVRAFVRLKALKAPHAELAAKLEALERRVTGHDSDLEEIILALRRLVRGPMKPRRAIGFATPVAAVPAVPPRGPRPTGRQRR